MDEVLEGSCLPMEAVINDVFNLVLHFSCHEVRWLSCVVGPVGHIFMIRGQQGGMEDVMDGPGQRKLELISNR